MGCSNPPRSSLSRSAARAGIRYNVTHVFPTLDPELQAWAGARDEWLRRHGIVIFVDALCTVEDTDDKRRTQAVAEAAGISVPLYLGTGQTGREAARQFLRRRGAGSEAGGGGGRSGERSGGGGVEPATAAVVGKPVFGRGSVGVEVLESEAALDVYADRWAVRGEEVIYQQYVEGRKEG